MPFKEPKSNKNPEKECHQLKQLKCKDYKLKLKNIQSKLNMKSQD